MIGNRRGICTLTFLLTVILMVFLVRPDAEARFSAQEGFDAGMRSYESGDYKQAAGWFQRAIWYAIEEKIKKNWEFKPGDFEIGSISYFYRGLCYLKLGQAGLAVQDFQSAEKWSDGLPEVQMNLGAMFFKMEKYEDAVRLYKKAVAAAPRNGLAHYYLGLSYLETKDYSAAWEHARRAKELGVQYTALIEKLEKVAPASGKTD